MVAQRHIIKRQVLELHATGERDAQRLRDEFARIYRQRIVPLIDRYCTELSEPDRTHRIRSLELDLGPVDPDRLEADVIARVGARLKSLLASHMEQGGRVAGADGPRARHDRPGAGPRSRLPRELRRELQRESPRESRRASQGEGDDTHARRPPRPPSPARKSLHGRSHAGSDHGEPPFAPARETGLETTARLELFMLFAGTGTLPWWADSSDVPILDKTLEHLITRAPDRLRRALRQLARGERPLRRIVSHYPDHRLLALFELLAPSLARALPDLPRRLIALMQRSGVSADALAGVPVGKPPVRIRHRVWVETLRLASMAGQAPPESSAFFRELVMRVAVGIDVDYAALVAGMRGVAAAGGLEAGGIREAVETFCYPTSQIRRSTTDGRSWGISSGIWT